MTIEATLQSIDGSLISIAASLEKLATGGSLPVPEKPAAKGKSGKAKPTASAGKSTSTEQSAPTKTADADAPKLADVRAALGAVQKAYDPNTARALLKEAGGAPTMSKLSEDMYQTVIDAAAEKVADAD